MSSLSKNTYAALFWIGETNFVIALAASMAMLTTYGLYHAKPDLGLVGFVFFSTLFIYNLQRRVGDIQHSGMFYGAKTVIMLIALVGMLVFVFLLSFIEILTLCFAAVFAAGYVLPLVSVKGKRLALREIPYVKIWVIVLVWVITTGLIPLLSVLRFNHFDDLLSLFFYLLQQGCLILALTIPFDIRDQRLDNEIQHTLPMDMGLRRSRKMAQRAMIGVFVFCFLNFLMGFFAFQQMLGQLGISIIGYVVVGFGWKIRDSLYYSIVLDGMIVLQGIVVVFIGN